ncbi:MAG TPA: DUF4401 domain-containing protein [Usitatibacter sp.]|nr:DUF4401 domain-containing protein [Usitatibacter sp.]
MIATPQDLVQALQARGFALHPASAQAPAEETSERPWFVSLLLGAAGWAAGIFVLIFVGMTFARGSNGGAGILVAGLVLLAMAYGLFWAAGRAGFAAFASQAALALSIAGQFATLFGLAESIDRNLSMRAVPTLATIALAMQVILAAVMPNRLHRTMSTLFACIAWAVALRFSTWDRAGVPAGIPASAVTGLSIWLATWLPLAGLLFVIVRREPMWIARGFAPMVRPIAAGLVVALALGTLASEPWALLVGPGSAHGGLAPWPLLSALAALAALIAAFALGNLGLAAVCIAAAIGHVFHLYYSLEATLLAKAATLAVVGAGCLAAAWLTRTRSAP